MNAPGDETNRRLSTIEGTLADLQTVVYRIRLDLDAINGLTELEPLAKLTMPIPTRPEAGVYSLSDTIYQRGWNTKPLEQQNQPPVPVPPQEIVAPLVATQSEVPLEAKPVVYLDDGYMLEGIRPIYGVAVPAPAQQVLMPTAAQVTDEPSQPPFWADFSFDSLRSGEFWLNKLGIALLLLGVAFLFNYAIDQGWLTEPIRVGFGLALGSVLLVFGLRLHERLRHFSQVLLGGSIAIYYITGFAAYQLFHLVGFYDAFLFMVGVTTLAFVLAIRQNEAMLSLIGVAGGLATPFLLYSSERNLLTLVAYTLLVLAGAGAIYFFRGWRSLLWTAFGGGWAVLFAAISSGALQPLDQWALQLGIVGSLLLFWVLPLVRDVLRIGDPERWPHPRLDWLSENLSPDVEQWAGAQAHIMSILTPLLALGLSMRVGWIVPQTSWGPITIVASLAFWFAAVRVREYDTKLAYTQAATGLMLTTLGLIMWLQGDTLLFAIAAEATLLHFVAWRLNDKGTAIAGHLLMASAGYWLLWRLVAGIQGGQQFSIATLTDLAVIALVALSAMLVKPREVGAAYLAAAEFAFGCWLWRQAGADSLWGYAMLASAGYALFLHSVAPRLKDEWFNLTTHLMGHIAFAVALLPLAARLIMEPQDVAELLALRLPLNILTIGLIVATIAILKRNTRTVAYYCAVLYAAVVAWLAHELIVQPNGASLTLLAWAAFGLSLHLLASRLQPRLLSDLSKVAAHIMFALVFALLGAIGLTSYWLERTALLNVAAFVQLGAVALIWVASTRVGVTIARQAYQVMGHMSMLMLLWSQFIGQPDGGAMITLAWGIYGAIVLVAGVIYRRDKFVVNSGLVLLALVSAKLLLIDMTGVDQLWRILLFLGFGGLFLLLSFYLQNVFKQASG